MLTDEAMEEFAQWQHDESLTVPDLEIPTEADCESFEILMMHDCLNGLHAVRFGITNNGLTAYCEDGCS